MFDHWFCNHTYEKYHTNYYMDYCGYRVKREYYRCTKCGKTKIVKWY